MSIFFDVGANNGQDSIRFSDDTNNIVYAFEADPFWAQTLTNLNRPNYKVINKAVTEEEGVKQFFIAPRGNRGCGSLNEFEDNLYSQEGWNDGRSDLVSTETINVECIRLDSFCDQNNITEIEYLHCDAQGHDFKVLLSLGKYIDCVKQGRVEVWLRNPLYKDIEDNYVDNVVNFLTSKGFDCNVVPHSNSNEADIFFVRK